MDYNADRGRCENIHGRARALFGQHLHRTPLAVLEAGGCVFARVNRWFCGRTRHSRVDQILQHRPPPHGSIHTYFGASGKLGAVHDNQTRYTLT